VVVRRPGWLGWALGSEKRERLQVRAPVAHLRERWLTIPPRSALRVRFDRPVSAVAAGPSGHLVRRALAGPSRSVTLGHRGVAGTVEVAVAARPWERLGTTVPVSWFPPARSPVAVTTPAAGTELDPAAPIRLTFSKPVA